MKKYILDTFQIPLNEEESKKYFFKSIKEMNMLERKIYLKNEILHYTINLFIYFTMSCSERL